MILKTISTTVKHEIAINFHSTLHGMEECPLPAIKEKKKGHQSIKEVGQKNILINASIRI